MKQLAKYRYDGTVRLKPGDSVIGTVEDNGTVVGEFQYTALKVCDARVRLALDVTEVESAV